MDIARIDFTGDARNGLHLERAIDSGGKFPTEHSAILTAIRECSCPGPDNLTLVAAVPVRNVLKDEPNWHLGNNRYTAVTAGMCVIGVSDIEVWACDGDRKPVYRIASLPIDDGEGLTFMDMAVAGYIPPLIDESAEKRAATKVWLREKIRWGTKHALVNARGRFKAQAAALHATTEELERLENLLLKFI